MSTFAPAAFAGEWAVRRKIVDHLAATTAIFTGQATITSSRFEENGSLALGANRLRATRAYRLRFGESEVGAEYQDGSEFFVVRVRPSQTVRHQCGADLYVGSFFFIDENSWAEAWRVTGPRKRYASVSRYVRIQAKSGWAAGRALGPPGLDRLGS